MSGWKLGKSKSAITLPYFVLTLPRGQRRQGRVLPELAREYAGTVAPDDAQTLARDAGCADESPNDASRRARSTDLRWPQLYPSAGC